jgi:hypothetical protein
VMSSAYVIILILGEGEGISERYMLNNVGDRTPPRDTPVLNIFCFELILFTCVKPFLPLM